MRSWGAPLIMGREDQGLRRLADLLESQRFFSDLRRVRPPPRAEESAAARKLAPEVLDPDEIIAGSRAFAPSADLICEVADLIADLIPARP